MRRSLHNAEEPNLDVEDHASSLRFGQDQRSLDIMAKFKPEAVLIGDLLDTKLIAMPPPILT